jgi:hypothetical protein
MQKTGPLFGCDPGGQENENDATCVPGGMVQAPHTKLAGIGCPFKYRLTRLVNLQIAHIEIGRGSLCSLERVASR